MPGFDLELRQVALTFPEDGVRRTILDVPFLRVYPGERIGLRGASGSGKSTFLNVLAGLVLPERGDVLWNGNCPGELPEHQRDLWRGQHIGFIFQDFRLFYGLNALENVLLPVTFEHWRVPEALMRRAQELLKLMNIPNTRRVANLSRGECQRVAIARAVLREPEILLADEPTASLDAANARRISTLLLDWAQELGSTLIVVSHDEEVLARMDRVLGLHRGALEGGA